MNIYTPISPSGEVLIDLVAETEDKAWKNLLNKVSVNNLLHKEDLKVYGYTLLRVWPKYDPHTKREPMAYIPVTPAGTVLMHLESKTEEEAWLKLLEDASHMPYEGKAGFQQRGYTVEKEE